MLKVALLPPRCPGRSAPQRVRDLRASPIRALLERTQNPEIISFAGGLPAADSFDDLVLPAAPTRFGLQIVGAATRTHCVRAPRAPR